MVIRKPRSFADAQDDKLCISVILRTEGTKNLGFETLKQKSSDPSGYARGSFWWEKVI